MTAAHAKKAIETLADAMENGENYATKVGAAKSILAKCIPDLKAQDIKFDGGSPLKIIFQVATQDSKDQLEQLYAGSNSSND